MLAGGQTRHFILAGTQASDFDPNAKSTYMDEALVGYEREALPGMSVGIRYIHRNMPRILEDVGTAPMLAYELGLPGLDSVEYFITNVNSKTPVTQFAASTGWPTRQRNDRRPAAAGRSGHCPRSGPPRLLRDPRRDR